MSLVLYGVPFSQPVRAVMWLLFLKKAPFEMVLINPGSKGETGSRNPAFLAKNPSGTIPCIEETETGFTLGEAHAIMTYLARTRGWTDVYPERRANSGDHRCLFTLPSQKHPRGFSRTCSSQDQKRSEYSRGNSGGGTQESDRCAENTRERMAFKSSFSCR